MFYLGDQRIADNHAEPAMIAMSDEVRAVGEWGIIPR